MLQNLKLQTTFFTLTADSVVTGLRPMNPGKTPDNLPINT